MDSPFARITSLCSNHIEADGRLTRSARLTADVHIDRMSDANSDECLASVQLSSAVHEML